MIVNIIVKNFSKFQGLSASRPGTGYYGSIARLHKPGKPAFCDSPVKNFLTERQCSGF
jgi:hypothetical protein